MRFRMSIWLATLDSPNRQHTRVIPIRNCLTLPLGLLPAGPIQAQSNAIVRPIAIRLNKFINGPIALLAYTTKLPSSGFAGINGATFNPLNHSERAPSSLQLLLEAILVRLLSIGVCRAAGSTNRPLAQPMISLIVGVDQFIRDEQP